MEGESNGTMEVQWVWTDLESPSGFHNLSKVVTEALADKHVCGYVVGRRHEGDDYWMILVRHPAKLSQRVLDSKLMLL